MDGKNVFDKLTEEQIEVLKSEYFRGYIAGILQATIEVTELIKKLSSKDEEN